MVLRNAWAARRLPRQLVTTKAKSVEVLEWGDLNPDAGPDVRDALIRIGGTLYRGDVELHVDARAWDSHGHDGDDHYNGVILHVAFRSQSHQTRTASGRIVPLVILDYSPEAFPPPSGTPAYVGALRCFDRNNDVPLQTIHRLLHQLGRERLKHKAYRVESRLKELALEQRSSLREPFAVPFSCPDEQLTLEPTFTRSDFARGPVWDQLLYEGVMECLGYAKNRTPMLRLAQSLRLEFIRRFSLDDTLTMESMLFGAAGLLPTDPLTDDEDTLRHISELKSRWREIRTQWPAYCLHPAEWIFFRLRPANFPTARLAVMAALLPRLFAPPAFRRLVETARVADRSPRATVHAFSALFDVKPGAYWEQRCLFGPQGRDGVAALGLDRIHDVLINVVVPLLLTFACVFGDRRVRTGALKLYAGMGPLQNNIIIQRMRNELVKGRFPVDRAAIQQALLQLHNIYCTKGRCEKCAIGRKESRQ